MIIVKMRKGGEPRRHPVGLGPPLRFQHNCIQLSQVGCPICCTPFSRFEDTDPTPAPPFMGRGRGGVSNLTNAFPFFIKCGNNKLDALFRKLREGGLRSTCGRLRPFSSKTTGRAQAVSTQSFHYLRNLNNCILHSHACPHHFAINW